jgi:hypothetical protein
MFTGSIGVEIREYFMNGPVKVNPGTQQDAAQALADYVNLANQIRGILSILADLKGREQEAAYSTLYANTKTYSLNPDGTAGAEDPTPVPANPMVGTSLSVQDVNGFVGYVVNDLHSFLTGVAGPTVADRRPAIYGMLP